MLQTGDPKGVETGYIDPESKEEDISEALERIATLEAEALARAPLNGQLH